MQWIEIDSTRIAKVAHDGKDLHVEFPNGKRGKYLDVPVGKHEELLASPSKGRYLNAMIIPDYEYVSVS